MQILTWTPKSSGSCDFRPATVRPETPRDRGTQQMKLPLWSIFLVLAIFLGEFARAASPLDVAQRERGVKQDSARQYEYLRVVNGRDFVIATATGGWCGAFAKWALLQAGYQAPKGLDVNDWLACGQPVTKPAPGDLVVFRHHVAFFVSRLWFNGQILVLGGAQAQFPGDHTSVCQLWVDEADVIGYRRPVPAAGTPSSAPARFKLAGNAAASGHERLVGGSARAAGRRRIL